MGRKKAAKHCQNPKCKKGEDGKAKQLRGRQQKFCCNACKQAVHDMKKATA